MDARDYDLVISCSHCVAKAIPRSARAAHACYCFTPMRYVWDSAADYRRQMGPAGWGLRMLSARLRAWDRRTADNVDLFLSNSKTVAERIARHYGRPATVVYSPIDADFFTPDTSPREDFYLMVGALAPYKRTDQAIAAFAALDRPLRIIGSGPQWRRLRRRAPANVTLMGWQSDTVVREHYRRCRALIFPGCEDFGLAPLEAMACGAPVIAYGAGGATETVLDPVGQPVGQPGQPGQPGSPDGPTGLLYTPQTADALAGAVRQFERIGGVFQPDRLAAWARRFSQGRFIDEFRRALQPLLRVKGLAEPWSSSTQP
jgi:glycosyltransferase involved in cell wall biosynthesis